jgi:GDP-fucose transporter C1
MGEKTSLKAILACFGVVLGFLCGIRGEMHISLKGTAYGVTSSAFVALYSIAVKKVIGLLDGNEYLLIEYLAPMSIVILTPFAWYSGELNLLLEGRSFRVWMLQTLAGGVGFFINIAIFLNIKYTTPLTHNLSGTVKACIQTLLAFVVFPGGEVVTLMKFVGTALVIGSSACYAYIRKTEMKQGIERAQEESLIQNVKNATLSDGADGEEELVASEGAEGEEEDAKQSEA